MDERSSFRDDERMSDTPSADGASSSGEGARLAAARRALGQRAPKIGVVLGSGLGGLTARFAARDAVPYAAIPHMPSAHVPGHAGELVFGTLGGARVVALSGRCHLYEGHPIRSVVFGVRLLAELGVESVIVTNAAGGIAPSCTKGALMRITDHINLTGQNPMLGPDPHSKVGRFVDLSAAYDAELGALADEAAGTLGFSLASGVYAGLLGPSYETPAEIRMLEALGASAVGMSTVSEVIALRALGVRVLGISCITNRAAGKGEATLSHTDVAETARLAATRFESLVETVCKLAR